MGSDSETVSTSRQPSFVEVHGANGKRRRFAAGTKAGFALDRINRSEAEMSRQYSVITAVKEGEEVIEFGPDAELVSYGDGWKLNAVQELKVVKSVPVSVEAKAKDEMKNDSPPVRKWYMSSSDLPPYRPQRDGLRYNPPQIASSADFVGHSKVGKYDLLELDKKHPMIIPRRNLSNWPHSSTPKWCWPTEPESGISSKQRRERNFVWANPEKRHTILTRIYCPSLSPPKPYLYNVDKY
ncbi:unnamed protein product [Calypogeia fissa]